MQIFRFDAQAGRVIDRFGSINVVLASIAHLTAEAHVRCMHLGPGGLVGRHPAATPQLFLVMQGEGWVCGESSERIPIAAGRAAFWQKNEWHESSTDTGMMAIVIESETLIPEEFMRAG